MFSLKLLMSLEPPTAKPMVSESLDQGKVTDGAPLNAPAASLTDDGGVGAPTGGGAYCSTGGGWVEGVGGMFCTSKGVESVLSFGAAQAEASAVARSIRMRKMGRIR